MARLMFVALVVGSVLSVAALRAAQPADATGGGSEAGERRDDVFRKHVESMTRQAKAFEIRRLSDPERPLDLVPEPVLRFTNPESGVKDGALFLWTADGRPEAIGQFFVNRLDEYVVELTSLSAYPLTAERGGEPNWSPSTPGLEMKDVPDAPEPAATRAGRLRQMRAMARAFSASVDIGNRQTGGTATTALRLLPQPVYRYGDAESDVIDGALFAFVWTTNPEVLLLIEAEPTANGQRWRYGLVPVSGYAVRASVGGIEVWSLPDRLYPQDRTKPWFAQMGAP